MHGVFDIAGTLVPDSVLQQCAVCPLTAAVLAMQATIALTGGKQQAKGQQQQAEGGRRGDVQLPH